MPRLRELQRELSAAIFERRVPAFLDDQRAGLGAYRSNVLSNLGQALAAVYPVCRQVLGEEFFDHAARQYALRRPSRSGDIHDYGDAFAALLAELPGAAELLYLPDLARLEWRVHRLFHAGDRPSLDVARIAAALAADGAGLELELDPACHVLAADYPVQDIWYAHRPGSDPEPMSIERIATCLLLRRRDDDTRIEVLTTTEFTLLDALQRGESLERALEVAAAVDPAAELHLVLGRRIGDGTLVERLVIEM